MIIVGFPGIGKTTLCRKLDNNYIDLDSSIFRTKGDYSPEGWEKLYIDIAIKLSKQGFNVFISSHKVVRDELIKRLDKWEIIKSDILYIFPDGSLADYWVDKLKRRYEITKDDKDLRAYNKIKAGFVQLTTELDSDVFCKSLNRILIKNRDYELNSIVDTAISMIKTSSNFYTLDYVVE